MVERKILVDSLRTRPHQIQAVLGGNLAMVFSGSAPISADVMDFLKIAFACDVIEGEGIFHLILGLYMCSRISDFRVSTPAKGI